MKKKEKRPGPGRPTKGAERRELYTIRLEPFVKDYLKTVYGGVQAYLDMHLKADRIKTPETVKEGKK
jgi:hypothetical protein